MNQFISCDWGTSSFRLRMVELETQNILAEVVSRQGISATYQMWEKSSSNRFLFYESVLSSGIAGLSPEGGFSVSGVPIVISGMASSSIGMLELDYKILPVKTDGSDLLVHPVAASARFKHPLLFVSGVRSAEDAMRGEETIIAGCELKKSETEQLLILPGTHSKHITTKDGIITGCKTYMTGEFFDLLAIKSILSTSVEPEKMSSSGADDWFAKGVKEARDGNLLNSVFHVRTHHLFDNHRPKENYHYLSGLLIGAELKDLLDTPFGEIILVADERFSTIYLKALHLLEMDAGISQINADKALIKGQSVVFKNYRF